MKGSDIQLKMHKVCICRLYAVNTSDLLRWN